MSIQIEIEKIIVQGEQKVQIVSFKALSKKQLPLQYLKGEYCLIDQGIAFRFFKNQYEYYFDPLFLNGVYSRKKFYKRVDFVRKCGECLKNINTELKKKNVKWYGKEKLTI